MSDLFAFTIVGLVTGSAYAIAASGLVITYATSNVFNMAHGAMGMLMAFLFWELAENRGVPRLLALVLVVAVAAPAVGAIIEKTLMRRLTNATVTVSLTVTVGLLVFLFGLAQVVWPPQGRSFEPFFSGRGLQLGQVFVSGHELTTFVLAIVVAFGLYYLLVRTRTGTGMRAIVDDRTLLALHGARPGRLAALSWALGSALAALAGILLIPQTQLDYLQLTLLVISAYAAAMVGRLKNLPRTIVGAMLLGLLQAYFLLGINHLPEGIRDGMQGFISGVRATLPTIFLFVVMLLLPQASLRAGELSGAALVRAPSWRQTLGWGGGLVALVVLVTPFLSTSNTARLGQSLVLALIMLSLVVLTGYGGDVSLGQLTFVGLGALLVARGFETVGPLAVVAAGLLAAVAGAVVAVPALRLRGLYLGLGTLAFAAAMDKLVFESPVLGFGLGGSRVVERPTLLGISLASERAFAVVVALVFVAAASGVLAIRRGRLGRLILATRDSPAACSTLGLNITATRVTMFTISAGMAGVAGAMFAGMYVSVGADMFTMFRSLPILLLAVIGGITSVTGALIGGLALGWIFPVMQDAYPALGGIVNLSIGGAAILIGRNPNGIAGVIFSLGGRRGERERAPTPALVAAEEAAPAGEVDLVGSS